MPKKRIAVLFEQDRIPRVFTNPSDEDIDSLRTKGKVLIDPKIPKGVSLEKWSLLENRIQIGSEKELLSSVIQIVKEIDVENQPSYSDIHELEDEVEYIKLELLDKLNKTCIMGALMALFFLLVSFREEIQQIIRDINV